MTRANFCIGRGHQADRTFADAAGLAHALLALLSQAGHHGAPFGLRDCNVARDAAHASGMCVSVTVYSPEGPAVDVGFAYLFTPFGPDARDRLARAIAQADPDWTCRPRPAPAAAAINLERSAA